MKYASHLLLIVLTASLVVVGMSYMVASNTRTEGRSLVRWLLFEMRRSEALQQRATEISHALEIKKAVVDDLIAERLTLREAVEEFRQADELIENDSEGLVAPYRMAKTEDELWRQVIAWTQTELIDDPQQSKEVMRRLEKERLQQTYVEGSAE